jgi:hypothetical protein
MQQIQGRQLSKTSKPKLRISKRTPHNEVERKYRHGLCSAIDRLRSVIPNLPQSYSTPDMPHKISKATVLASAVEYILDVEAERDQLRAENTALRSWRTQQDCVIHALLLR